MRFFEIEYKITKPVYHGIGYLFDMFRYSQDSVLKIINEHSWIMLRHVHYEDEEHKKRRIAHFKKQVMPRWESFGCKVEIIMGMEILKDEM